MSMPLTAQVGAPPSIWWKSSGTTDSMNFNPACRLSGDTSLRFPVPNLGKECDVLIVYESADSTEEGGLWQLQDSMGKRIGLTSQRILNEYGDIRFGNRNAGAGVVNYLSQSWKEAPSGDTLLLTAGQADVLPFRGRLGEFLYFSRRLEDTSVTQWMSYLAVKYGITLYRTSYLNSLRQCTWDYDESAGMSDFIAGVGRDDAFGLCQSRTRFHDGRMLLELSGGTALQDHDFIIFGKDGTPINERVGRFVFNDTLWEVYGRTRVQVTGDSARTLLTSVTLEDTLWSSDGIATWLVVVHDETEADAMPEMHPAARRDSDGRLKFDNLRWDSDGNGSDLFFFARMSENQGAHASSLTVDAERIGDPDGMFPEDVASARKNPKSDAGTSTSGLPQYGLYPNPSQGSFLLSIDYPEESAVKLCIYASDGKMLRQREYPCKKSHRILEHIENRGVYILDIRSEHGHKLLKMVVN